MKNIELAVEGEMCNQIFISSKIASFRGVIVVKNNMMKMKVGRCEQKNIT